LILVNGICIKANNNIMGKTRIHLDDKSNNGESVDLTITTKDMVKEGEEVILEGKIALNLDLGAGYFFEVLMEDAKIITP